MVKARKDRVISFLDDPNVIIVSGKKYKLAKVKGKIIDHHLHGDKIIFEPFDEKKHKEDIDFIVSRIKDSVNKDEILREIVKHMPIDRMDKITKMLKKNASIKVTKGCYALTIGGKGGEVIDIVR